jgi:hypothetical protein
MYGYSLRDRGQGNGRVRKWSIIKVYCCADGAGQSLGFLKKAKIGVLVAETIKWCNKQVPLPFLDAVGSVIQTLATLKEERDKFLTLCDHGHDCGGCGRCAPGH